MSAAVVVDSSHMTASSPTSWSRFSPPSNFVNGHMSTVWFMVCRWPQSQEGDWARPHLCKLAQRGPWPVQKRFIRDHVWRGRSKPGCQMVGSVTIVWLTTEADDQSWHLLTLAVRDAAVTYIPVLLQLQLRNYVIGCDWYAKNMFQVRSEMSLVLLCSHSLLDSWITLSVFRHVTCIQSICGNTFAPASFICVCQSQLRWQSRCPVQ